MTNQEAQLSSYLAIKGLLDEDTYRAFGLWDLDASVVDNLKQIEATNAIGAKSDAWLKHIVRNINQRYEIDGSDRQLVELVHQGWHIDQWRPLQLWHATRQDELLRDFLIDWLFQRRNEGIVVITADAVVEYLKEITQAKLGSADAWKENTYRRAANGLLKTTTDFHLMHGRTFKEFSAYRLPEQSFIYLLYRLMERENNSRNVVHAEDWRIFLLKPNDVEEELLRLHQFGKLRFERAGSFLEITLPCNDTDEFVRSMAG